MSCEDIENLIPDYQERWLSPIQRRVVETHLAGCAACCTFARQFEQLDAALSSGLKVPTLSADFEKQLRKRIQVAPAGLSAEQRAERKRQIQAEFDAGWAQIAQTSFALESWLKHLAWPALAVLAGWVVWHLTQPFVLHLNAQSLAGIDPNLLPWLTASIVFLPLALANSFPRRWKTSVFR